MATYAIQPLGPETWDAYARLIERHNGVWGGCWCLAFHPKTPERGRSCSLDASQEHRIVPRHDRPDHPERSAAHLDASTVVIAQHVVGDLDAGERRVLACATRPHQWCP